MKRRKRRRPYSSRQVRQSRRHGLELLERRLLLAADWQNANSRLDVNQDTFVTPADVLVGINELNHPTLPLTNGQLPARQDHPDRPKYDTNGDNVISPLDSLAVINALNNDRSGPVVVAQLEHDTAPLGATNDDHLTSRPMIVGTVTDVTGVTSFQARVDGAGFADVPVAVGGAFTYDPGLAIDGTDDGQHLVEFVATDGLLQSTSPISFSFTLDTVAPPIVASALLNATSDTGGDNRDGVTQDDTPTFTIEADPGTTIELLADGARVGTGLASSPVEVTAASLSDGTYAFTARAFDQAGNVGGESAATMVTIDTIPPQLDIAAPVDSGLVHRSSRLEGTVDDPTAALRYAVDQGDPQPFAADRSGAFARSLFAGQLMDGPHSLRVTAEDIAGNQVVSVVAIDVEKDALPFVIREHAPRAGEHEIGVTQRVQVFFSKPVDPATLDAASFFAAVGGAPLPATIVPATRGEFAWLFFDEPLPGGTRVTVTVDGDAIRSLDGELLDGDGDGVAGGVRTFSFSTVSTAALPGTALTGRVMDPGPDNRPHTSDDVPLAGVDVFLLGRESAVALTGPDGRFTLSPVPAGNAKVVLNGLVTPAPDGVYFPEMVMDAYLEAGQSNVVMAGMEDVFLPRLNQSILQTVSADITTTIVADAAAAPELSAADRQRLSIEVPQNSLVAADGSRPATAEIGISTVPPELVVDMLPPGVLQHTFDITVQAMGVTNFSTPAPLSAPNVFGTPPGTQHNFLSFDHASGRLVIEGTATVSADGTTIMTDPGHGVTHPGWHGFTPSGGCGGSGGPPPMPPEPSDEEIVTEHDPIALDLLSSETGDTNFPAFRWQAPDLEAGETLPTDTVSPCFVPSHFLGATEFVSVFVEVDGPLAAFMKPAAGTATLNSFAATLFPGDPQDLQFDMVPKTYDEMFPGGGYAMLTKDRLYGAKIKVTEIRQTADGQRTRDIHTYYQYRWLSVVDPEDAEARSGTTAAFHKTLVDDGDFQRTKFVDTFVPRSSKTVFNGATFSGGELSDFTFDFDARGTSGTLWHFDPDGVGEETGEVDIEFEGLTIGTLTARGTGIGPTTIGVDLDGYKEELKRVILALKTAIVPGRDGVPGFPGDDDGDGQVDENDEYFFVRPGNDGLLGTADDQPSDDSFEAVYDYGTKTFTASDGSTIGGNPAIVSVSPVRDVVDYNGGIASATEGAWRTVGGSTYRWFQIASPRFHAEFAGLMPSDRELPGPDGILGTNDDQFTASQLASLDERLELKAVQLKEAIEKDFLPVNGGTNAYQIVDGTGDVNLVWEDKFNRTGSPLFGAAQFDADLPQLRTLLPDNDLPIAAKMWALAEYLNVDTDNDVGFLQEKDGFAVAINIGWRHATTSFADYVANTVSHEIAHTFGLQDAYTSLPVLPGPDGRLGTADDIPPGGTAMCNRFTNCTPFDIMRSGSSFDPDLTFLQQNLRQLQAAMGIHANASEELRAAVQQYRDTINLPDDVNGVREHGDRFVEIGDSEPAVESGPDIGVTRGDELLFGLSEHPPSDLGEAAVDGVGGAAAIVDYEVKNVGLAPLTVASVELLQGDQGISVSAASLVGLPIAAGDSASFSIHFDPESVGQFSDTVTLTSDAELAPTLEFTVRGTAFPGQPTASVSAVENPNVGGAVAGMETRSVAAFAEVSNQGLAPLQVEGITISAGGHDFSLAGIPQDLDQNPITLARGEVFTFGLDFHPSRIGLLNATIEVHSNDPLQPVVAFLAVGTGTEVVPVAEWGEDHVAIRTPEADGTPVLRAQSNEEGDFNFFLPAEERYALTVFDPTSGLVAVGHGITATSGEALDLTRRLVFQASTAPDGDGDGLPRDIEFAIGTLDDDVDTNGDGISDFDSLQAGIDPLAGSPAQTGLIGVLPLDHPANDLAIATNRSDAGQLLAYVATGESTGGLAIVDLSNPGAPILVSELALPGNSRWIEIDTARGLAAVTGDVETHLVDIADPTAPQLRQTLAAGRMTLFDGHAYLVQGTMLKSVSLTTGEVRDDRPLANEGGFTDLQRVGSRLYTMSGNGRLRIFDLVEDGSGRIVERGELRVLGTAGRLHVHAGVAYLMTTTAGRRPFVTVDVSDPDRPVRLSAEGGGPLLPRTDFITNGSSLGYLIGRNPIAPFDERLSVIDVSDPAADPGQVTVFTLPEAPRGIGFGNGVIFVATGTDRTGLNGTGAIHALNFPSFDVAGSPPEVTLGTPFDDDGANGGLQVIEGSLLPISVNVTDDVQLRHVELLMNGRAVAHAVHVPYEFEVAMPLDAGGAPVELQARAVDSGGNVSLSNTLMVDLIADNRPPRITLLEPLDGGFRPQGPIDVLIGFDEELAPSSLQAARFMLRDAGGGAVTPDQTTFLPTEVKLQFDSLPSGVYSLAIDGANVMDLAGNVLANDAVVSSFTVGNGTVFWTNPGDGQWHEPANWSTGQVPGPDDDVVIGVAGAITVTVSRNEPRPQVNRLFSEELLVADGGLILDGASSLRGGLFARFGAGSSQLTFNSDTLLGGQSLLGAEMDGAGTLTNTGVLTFLDGEVSEIHVPFVNQSHVRVDAASLEPSTTITNEGTWEFRALATIDDRGGRFANSGEVLFTSPLADVTFSVPFDNHGPPLEIPIGRRLALRGGGTFTDTSLAVDEGGLVEILGGDVTFTNVQVTGDGTFTTVGGTLTVPADTVTTFDLGPNTLELGAALGGSFELLVEGTAINEGFAIWHGANVTVGASGEFVNAGHLRLLNRNRNLAGHFENTGVVEYGGGTLNMNGATIDNQGTWDFQGLNTIVNRPGTNAFHNSGLVLVSSDQTATIEVPLHNQAVLLVEDGQLLLNGGGTQTDATIHVAVGALGTLSFGDILVSGTTSFDGAGALENSAGNITVDATATLILDMEGDGFTTRSSLAHEGLIVMGAVVNSGQVTLSRGALDVQGTFDNLGTMTWTGNGRLTGGGFANLGVVDYTSTVGGVLESGTVVNFGQWNHRATRSLTIHTGTFINDQTGVFEISDVGGFDPGFASQLHLFDNRGVFRRTGAAASVLVDVGFVSEGDVELLGDTTFADGFVQTAGRTALLGGNLSVNAHTVDLQGGTLEGSGQVTGNVQNDARIEIGGANQTGTLSITGSYTQGAGGVVALEIGGAAVEDIDRLVTNTQSGAQTTVLDGELSVSLIGDFAATAGDSFEVLAFDAVSGDFATFLGLDLPNDLVLEPQAAAGSYTLVAMQALRAAVAGGTGRAALTLDAEAADALFAGLVDRLVAEGLSHRAAESLREVEVRIVDLGGERLALAGRGELLLDDDGAGFGWFVDSTPYSDYEFARPMVSRVAPLAFTGAAGRYDLLTVLAHELAHLSGANHNDGLVPLSQDLGLGQRELVNGAALELLFARSGNGGDK